MYFHDASFCQRFQSLDDGKKLHPIIRRGLLPSADDLLPSSAGKDRAITAGTRVSATRSVGVHRDERLPRRIAHLHRSRTATIHALGNNILQTGYPIMGDRLDRRTALAAHGVNEFGNGF